MEPEIVPIPGYRKRQGRRKDLEKVADKVQKSKRGEAVKFKADTYTAARGDARTVAVYLRRRGVQSSTSVYHDGTFYVWKVENENDGVERPADATGTQATEG